MKLHYPEAGSVIAYPHLGYVNGHKTLGEFSKAFADIMEGAILAVFQNDIKVLSSFDKTLVLHNIWVLSWNNATSIDGKCRRGCM